VIEAQIRMRQLEEDEKNAVGERIVTKAIVEQIVEGVSTEEIDPPKQIVLL
jgi:multiple RNA-binding domain-containing protein 1